MAYNFKEVMNKPERLAPGHRMCAGCGGTITVRTVLRALHEGDKAVIGNATGCLEVSTFMYPYTAYEDSYIHNAFENAGATLSGVETAYNVLKKKGKIDDTYKFITFGGDGGTYDIGLQSLSGAMERGHDMVYVCYDNGAYMNTGIQRSSATPMYADTTTTPVGSQSMVRCRTERISHRSWLPTTSHMLDSLLFSATCVISMRRLRRPYTHLAQLSSTSCHHVLEDGDTLQRRSWTSASWQLRHATGLCSRLSRANGSSPTLLRRSFLSRTS